MEWKPPCRANGEPVNPCYSRTWDQIVEGKFVLTGAWSGWKIQATGKLVGPGGLKFSPSHLVMLWQLRRGLFEALRSEALNGPTVFKQMHNLWDAVTDAANDDGTGLAVEATQARLPGL